MNPEQQKSLLAIALFAAFADGNKHDRERDEIRLAESLAAGAGAPDLARLYQDVLLKRVTLDAAAAALADPGERQMAYEMAVCVCDADGRQSDTERRFLDELKALLRLDAGQAEVFERRSWTTRMFSKRIAIFRRRLSQEDAETYARRLVNKWKCVIIRITPARFVSFDYAKG